MSERLEPIPTPRSQLWRQLRRQYVPVVVFVAGLVAAAFIWARWVAPATIMGEAEAIRADVRSVRAGALESKVALLQPVKAGETIAQVVPDANLLEASLAVIRAELDSIRYTMDPVVGQQRFALDYERLALDLMKARVDLASLQAQLFQAESNLARSTTLHANKLLSEERFEEIKNTRDSLAAQVKAQTDLVTRIEPGLNAFTTQSPDGKAASLAVGLRSAIKVQEEKLRLTQAQLGPVALTAPLDGVITLIHRQPGETVAAGEPIFQVSATQAKRIVGFIRQPLSVVPKAGTEVEVRTRTFERHAAFATISQIGSQLEPISPTLLAAMRLPVSNIPTELGLRVILNAPPTLNLRPGEQVDLIVRD